VLKGVVGEVLGVDPKNRLDEPGRRREGDLVFMEPLLMLVVEKQALPSRSDRLAQPTLHPAFQAVHRLADIPPELDLFRFTGLLHGSPDGTYGPHDNPDAWRAVCGCCRAASGNPSCQERFPC